MNVGMFSSKTDLWSTPQWLFDKLDNEEHFTLDACALPDNAKCSKYFTPEDDGLKQSWKGHRVWCNPPYGRGIGKWVEKAWWECTNPGTSVTMLLPARTDTSWFHDWCMMGDITFIRGRLRFGGAKCNAPFPSMIVRFGNRFETISNKGL